MELRPLGRPVTGEAPMFTGTVLLTPLLEGGDLGGTRASMTRFLPGARTAWHSHALGQVLHVTDGVGLVQSRGGDVVEVRAGDTIYTLPGEWHWHGATPDHFMAHLALWLVAAEDSSFADTTWGDPVSEDEYAGGARPAPLR